MFRQIAKWVSASILLPTALVWCGCDRREETPDGSGTIECTQVEVASEVAGRLIRVVPEEGAPLKQGDLVAEIDSKEHRLRRDEAKAQLAQAKAALDLALAGPRPEEIERARAQVREAKAAAEAAASNHRRIREVFERNSATQQQLDEAEAAAERTAAAAAAAEQQLAKLLAGSREEEIRLARAQVGAAEARLALLEEALADCTITAPIDGVVTERIREPGEVVAPGAPLVTLSRLDEVWLSVYVPASRLGRIRLGQAAEVKIDGLERRFQGRVTFVSPEAEFTPKNVQTPEQRARLVYRVKISLPNPDGIFKPGMPADGYLTSNAGAAENGATDER